MTFLFPHTGHVSEADSIFGYYNNASYGTYNSDYLTFSPTFASELMSNLPLDVGTVCQGSHACLYDYAISGSAELGTSSQTAAMNGQELEAILSKPKICVVCIVAKICKARTRQYMAICNSYVAE